MRSTSPGKTLCAPDCCECQLSIVPFCHLLLTFTKIRSVIIWHITTIYQTRGLVQKFCTLYVFSLKMNLFHKIHLQAFNVISIVLYHSGPTLGQVLYSCQDDFIFDASDYSGHLIRHLLSASEAFPHGVISSILGTSQRLVGSCQDCTAGGEALAIRTFPKFPILHLRHEAARYCMIAGHSARSDSSQVLLPFQGSVLQNTDHVACQYSHIVLHWSLAHNCRENQNNCFIQLAARALCAELLKWST